MQVSTFFALKAAKKIHGPFAQLVEKSALPTTSVSERAAAIWAAGIFFCKNLVVFSIFVV